MPLHPVRRLALAGALLLALTGCGASAAAPGSPPRAAVDSGVERELLGYDQMVSEYQAVKARLTLPAGIEFPATVAPPSQPTMYETGIGTTHAETFWLCAWEEEWLTTRASDPARAAAALAQLRTAPDTDFMSLYLDEAGRRLFAEYLQKADLGDPSGFQQTFTANCDGYR